MPDFYVQPANILPGFQAALQGVQTRAENVRKAEILDEGSQLLETGSPTDVAKFSMENPAFAAHMKQSIGVQQEGQEREIVEGSKAIISGDADPREMLVNQIQTTIDRGGDPTNLVLHLKRYDEDPTAGAELAKDKAMKNLAMYDKQAFESMQELGQYSVGKLKVGAQEILEDGTIIQSTQRGPIVYAPTGEQLKGQAAADAIKVARAEKVSNLRKAAGQKKQATLEAEDELKAKVEAKVVSAKEAAKISVDAFGRLELINKNIANIDEGIRLLEEGAETGVVESKLPSVRASSIKLDNLQNRLGLDVIGNTTFGALSEKELAFALDTAIPKKLTGPELKQWLTEKKVSQEKLADYLEAAAIFLGTPGNTVKDWMVRQRGKREEAAPPSAPPEQPAGQPSAMPPAEPERTATNPQTGEKMVLRGGQWVKMQ